MKVAVLASGSRGNCTYVETSDIHFLIDAGISNIAIERKLINLSIDPNKIEYIFITHTHVDHIAGLRVFIKKHHPIVFLSQKMYEELKDVIDDYQIIDKTMFIGNLKVEYFKTSHDTSDSVGYVFSCIDKSLVYVTDTGYINKKNYSLLTNHDLYIFESNHDIKLLMDNPNYPYHTKQRILSDTGHLSNKDSAYYLSKIIGHKTKTIILAHLSENNNDPILAYETINKAINDVKIIIAKQDNEMELLEL